MQSVPGRKVLGNTAAELGVGSEAVDGQKRHHGGSGGDGRDEEFGKHGGCSGE